MLRNIIGGARDIVTWGVPILVLLVAYFVFQVPVWFALALAAVLLGALYFLLNPRSPGQEDQEQVRLETEQLLRDSRDILNKIRLLAPQVPKQDVRDHITKITAMADGELSDMLAKPGTSLLTATRLKGVFSQSYDILNFYTQLVNGKVTTTDDKRAALTSQIESGVLDQLQTSLHDFASQQDQGEIVSLEASIRVLENTLKLEGLS